MTSFAPTKKKDPGDGVWERKFACPELSVALQRGKLVTIIPDEPPGADTEKSSPEQSTTGGMVSPSTKIQNSVVIIGFNHIYAIIFTIIKNVWRGGYKEPCNTFSNCNE